MQQGITGEITNTQSLFDKNLVHTFWYLRLLIELFGFKSQLCVLADVLYTPTSE